MVVPALPPLALKLAKAAVGAGTVGGAARAVLDRAVGGARQPGDRARLSAALLRTALASVPSSNSEASQPLATTEPPPATSATNYMAALFADYDRYKVKKNERSTIFFFSFLEFERQNLF